MKRKPTLADFKRFKREVLRLQKKLLVGHFEISFEWVPLKDADAYLTADPANGWAVFKMDTQCITRKPEALGRHEFAHLLTANIEQLARNRHARDEEISTECERIARILERQFES